ncbi:sigma factor-binding protein Crl [Vibrio sp. RE86]|uniref:sigma factor-binding protein Crl n=1 Tax=Vibrio sp. RE86 TaxID=2607605 RepID=UPI0014935DC5|nr:sigma factor-binding protein Crl [Vibrio sp. RE86]NOH81168.1 sigma factor-binding protein Crl [Vibrio sp. RE86]
MSEQTKSPTHYRLLTTLRAIGPYLRESQSEDGSYLFDCLSVCVNDKKSPEQREFWGWWLELEKRGDVFEARYRSGLYDVTGEWQDKALPKKAVQDVTKTQEVFHQKLLDTLQSEFEISVEIHKESVEFV